MYAPYYSMYYEYFFPLFIAELIPLLPSHLSRRPLMKRDRAWQGHRWWTLLIWQEGESEVKDKFKGQGLPVVKGHKIDLRVESFTLNPVCKLWSLYTFEYNLDAFARIFKIICLKVVCAVEVSCKKMLELWDIWVIMHFKNINFNVMKVFEV